jgi:hypothetical protein
VNIDPLYIKLLQDSNKNLTEIVNECIYALSRQIMYNLSDAETLKEIISVLDQADVLKKLDIAEKLNDKC